MNELDTAAPQLKAEDLGLSAKYEILSVIGQGGMSVVYKARHRFTEQLLAIKMLKGDLSLDKTHRARFLQEAQALEKLDHPNIVSARDVDYTSHGKPYLAMLFLEGDSIAERIKRDGPIEISKAIRIFLQCCDALEHAHKNGVVHRDLKPSNIVIVREKNDEETPKIVDFGIAKLIQDNEQNPALTQTGEVFGSPLYMSPEQCAGQQLDWRSDIYSLGCVMYETLSGRAPFEGNSTLEIMRKHTDDMAQPLAIPNCAPAVCKRLDQIIYKAMEKDPAHRYQSMAALKRDLERLNDLTESRGVNGITYVGYARMHRRFSKAIMRHPVRFAAVVASVVAAGAIAIFGWTIVVAPLTVTPTVMQNSTDWFFDDIEVTQPPPEYDEALRRLTYLINESQRRNGYNTIDSLKRRWKMAKYEERYGDWKRAAGQLEFVIDGLEKSPDYGPSNWTTFDAMQEYATCHYWMKDYTKSAEWFSKAWDRLLTIKQQCAHTVGNYFEPTLEVRLAQSLRMSGNFSAAKHHYQAVLTDKEVHYWKNRYSDRTGGELIQAMSLGGLGDCDVELAQIDTKQAKAFLDEANQAYEQSEKVWQKGSGTRPEFARNVTLCQNGIANGYIVSGDYANAASQLTNMVATQSGKQFLDRPQFRLNYARVLWHAHQFVKAIMVANKLS